MRKLATAAGAYLISALAAHYLLPSHMLLPLAAACAVLSLPALLFSSQVRMRIMIILLSAAVGLAWYHGYNEIKLAPARALYGVTDTVTITAADYPSETSYGVSFDARLHTDGRAVSTRVYADAELAGLQPGDTVTVTARLAPSDTVRGSGTDRFTSRGIYLLAYMAGEAEVTPYSGHGYAAKRLSRSILAKVDEIFPEDTRGFVKALILGDTAELNSDSALRGAMATAGISHVVSVSGMHVAFLLSFVSLFIRRRKLLPAIGIPVILLFMAAVGFRAAVVRAGVMQIFLLIAPLLRRENDAPTTLSAALLLLLLINPNAVGSVSLQLSFAATLGIILFTGRLYRAMTAGLKKRGGGIAAQALRGVLRAIAGGVSSSLGALAFSVPLSALHFGYVSLVSILANLLILWAVQLVFIGSFFAVAAGFVFTPAGALAGALISAPVRFIFGVAYTLSGFPFAALHLSNPLLLIWLVYVYVMVIILLAFKVKARTALYPVCLSIMSLCAVLVITAVSFDTNGMSVTALDVGQGQSIVVSSGSKTVMIDCGSSSGENAAKIANAHLRSRARTSVDLLVLTHYHDDHAAGVLELITRIPVAAIAAPYPDERSGTLPEEIIALATEKNIDIIYVTESMQLDVSGTLITLLAPIGSDSENERGLTVLCTSGDYDALITGDMSAELERQLLRTYSLPDTELFVAGHHGSRYSTCDTLLDAVTPEVCIISVGHNSYGHPAEETLARLSERAIAVYRTDIDGSVTISTEG